MKLVDFSNVVKTQFEVDFVALVVFRYGHA